MSELLPRWMLAVFTSIEIRIGGFYGGVRRGRTICAGVFPGDAPQKTQILVLGVIGAEELVEVLKTWFGFSFERPWGGAGSSGFSECERAGEAPPDAIVELFVEHFGGGKELD